MPKSESFKQTQDAAKALAQHALKALLSNARDASGQMWEIRKRSQQEHQRIQKEIRRGSSQTSTKFVP